MVHRILAILLVLLSCLAIAASDSVHFFVDTNFGVSGGHWIYSFSKSQSCIPMRILNDKVSSATWKDLPQTGNFANKGALIAFYTDNNCTGIVRTWPTTEKNFPSNFALDGINDQISSFMVWQTSDKVEEVAPNPRSLI